MKKVIRIVAIILCLSLVCTFVGCSANKGGGLYQSMGDFWQGIPDDDSDYSNIWGDAEEPDIDITVIGGDKELTDKEQQLADEAEKRASIYSLVCTGVVNDLNTAGFNTGYGVMYELEGNVARYGIYYSADDVNIYDNNEYLACGFYEITDGFFYDDINDESTFLIKDYSELDKTTADEELLKVYTYNYTNIGTYHFVYDDKYVQYYQEADTCIKFVTKDNAKENYDLTIGSLYDYDNNCYIYDASIYGVYEPHSGEAILGEEDYNQLKQTLKEQVEIQKEAGYVVNEYEIVYISPEAIQAYIDSEEEATFFGYNVSDLTETFGLGTALVYTEDGFKQSEVITPSDDEYNWKSFLIKCGIGCGIILVGAVLTPLTGGASFGCALLTISKFAVGYAISSAVGTLAIETVSGLIQGNSIEESLQKASHKGLDAFANGFMIGAAVGSIGVVSGLIKPTACFIAGTQVLMGNGEFKDIESVQVGDSVLSHDEHTGVTSVQRVTNTFNKKVDTLVHIEVGEEEIVTTLNHPFYLPKANGWIPAGKLQRGQELLTAQNVCIKVKSIFYEKTRVPVDVYNFTVENTHTYFVGDNSALVHNDCDQLTKNQIQNARNEAGRKAKDRALDDILNDRDYHGITDKDVINYIKDTGRFPSYKKGDPFQIDYAHPSGNEVHEILRSYREGAISKDRALQLMKDPDGGLLVTKEDHIGLIHGGDPHNPSSDAMFVFLRQKAWQLLQSMAA